MTEKEMEPKVNDQWISERQLRHGLMYVCRFVRAFETYSLSRMTRWTVYQKADIHRIMGLLRFPAQRRLLFHTVGFLRNRYRQTHKLPTVQISGKSIVTH